MGCDIHIFVEKKIGDKWVAICGKDPMEEYYRKHYIEVMSNPELPMDRKKYWINKYTEHRKPCLENWIYDGRNYSLFSLLADVRNGIRSRFYNKPATGRYIKPISDPRGLPDDASPEVLETSEFWNCNGHSRSYFTLKELQDYKPKDKIKYRNLVTKTEYEEFLKTGSPKSWCGGSNAKIISNEEMEQWIRGEVNYADGEFIQTILEWEEDVIESTELNEIIEKLAKLGGDPENVRIVFWFDN